MDHLFKTVDFYKCKETAYVKGDVLQNGRVRVSSTGPDDVVVMSEDFASMLGFSSTYKMFFSIKTSLERPNLNLDLPKSLYVYTNIVEPQKVGDIMARLLRVI